ncbi:isocitrate lyase/PEP mutase family protein [Falsiroseomonas stagni]|uniref:2-Methylisocitrate lyase, PEP mutase family n=1 Tax=Falsiroseomonas stagni DSM 19981 TaxID=1123062 RepID=A0A1I4D339_9PROT|nr:isocitrate lyase/PEP mutase family protein [Falsiroseomonas stagni]SFK87932.1 2-Methylisocitrate lyase, PEP mutase family [Falsiroseomonas stagni DSM 19981]
MPHPSLRQALKNDEFILAPGVFDMISAKVADGMGFRALYATGFGVTASHLGLADVGIATYTDMVSRMGTIAKGCKTPVISDADTGYGGLLNVRHTVRGYEDAGVTAIQLEDQEVPKKCGHTPGRKVIPAEEMALKIRVAAEARQSEDFLIIARTDARTGHGLDEAIRRGLMYADAGADVIFIESPESEAEMAEVGRHIKKPLFANMVEGGRTPIVPADKLHAMGYRIAIYPAVGFLTIAGALERAYGQLKADGHSNNMSVNADYSFAKMCELMGFPDVWEFDRKWAAAAGNLPPAKAAE